MPRRFDDQSSSSSEDSSNSSSSSSSSDPESSGSRETIAGICQGLSRNPVNGSMNEEQGCEEEHRYQGRQQKESDWRNQVYALQHYRPEVNRESQQLGRHPGFSHSPEHGQPPVIRSVVYGPPPIKPFGMSICHPQVQLFPTPSPPPVHRVVPRQIATINGPFFKGTLYENGMIQSSQPIGYFRDHDNYYNSVMSPEDRQYFQDLLNGGSGSSNWHALCIGSAPQEGLDGACQ